MRKKQVLFSVAIGYVELVYACSQTHAQDAGTEEVDNKRRVTVENTTAATKKRPDGLPEARACRPLAVATPTSSG